MRGPERIPPRPHSTEPALPKAATPETPPSRPQSTPPTFDRSRVGKPSPDQLRPAPARPEPESAPPSPQAPAYLNHMDETPMSPTGHRLQDLGRESTADAVHGGRLPIHPAGSFVMPRHTADAARMFKMNMDRMDPTGSLRQVGEFIQPFGLNHGRAVPAQPMRYAPGTSAPDIRYLPDTFTVIHSHPKPVPGGIINFPSVNDYLTAHTANRVMGHGDHMMYDSSTDKFYSYAGEHPPVFHEARFPEDAGAPRRNRHGRSMGG